MVSYCFQDSHGHSPETQQARPDFTVRVAKDVALYFMKG
jgi:hypothetical protein